MVVTAVTMCCLYAAPAHAADQEVVAGPGFSFAPAGVTVNEGESVTWTNAGGFHNVVFEDGLFTQPPFVSADAWSVTRTFDAAGTFRYFCDIHRAAGMRGVVDVMAVETTPEQQVSEPGASAQGSPLPAATAAPRCASLRRFKIRLRGLRRVAVRSARVEFNGKEIPVRPETIDGVRRHTADIDMRGLPRGAYTVAITVTTTSGRVLRGTRTYRTCMAKREPAKLPSL